MQKTFRFQKDPRLNYEADEATVSIQDHFRLLDYAQNYLQEQQTRQMRVSDSDAANVDLKQHIYISIDKLFTDKPHSGTNSAAYSRSKNHKVEDACSKGVSSILVRAAAKDAKKMLENLAVVSRILGGAAGQKLGKSPLDFLSKELSKFSSASEIFATRNLLPQTRVASQFHNACDNVGDVLVIIKSGQYIAGGYTEVPFDSTSSSKPNPRMSTFVFSGNRQRKYFLTNPRKALNCSGDLGPTFGVNGIKVVDDYAAKGNGEYLHATTSSFYTPDAIVGELFGTERFVIDEYEVYKLE